MSKGFPYINHVKFFFQKNIIFIFEILNIKYRSSTTLSYIPHLRYAFTEHCSEKYTFVYNEKGDK